METVTRITFVVDSSTYGGAEAYVAHLLSGLRTRFATTLLATPALPTELRTAAEAAGTRIVLAPGIRSKLDLGRLVRQTLDLRSTRPALVHLNLPVLASSRHVLAATAFMRVPTVATLHLVAPILSELQRRTLGHFYRRLPRVIAVSGETKEQLCRDLGVAESVVRVVPNGVPVREPLTLQDRTPVRVGGVGRLTAQKGFDLLIEAIRRLREHGLAVEAVIVGEGPDRAKLEAVAQGLPVTLEGFTPEVGSVLESLDIFCLPSRWEGLPFALLEAMMAGLPCVAARVGDVPEALGAAGALVPPDDLESLIEAVRNLVRSPARRRELGAAAHARAVERYSVDRMVAETADVYEGVLAG